MTVDLLTIVVVIALVKGICGLLLLYAWLLSRKTTALALFAAGYFISSIGTALIVGRGVISNFWSIDIAYALIAGAYGLIWSGARSFDNRRTLLSVVLAGALIWLVAYQVEASPRTRVVVISAIIAGYSLLCALEFWRARDKGLMSRWPIIAFLLLHAAIYLGRILRPDLLQFVTSMHELAAPGVALLAFEILVAAICAAFLLTHLVRERIELRHKHASEIDPLTGVANRRGFVEHGERLLRRATVEGQDVALLSFDLDRFKQINDTLGHHVGDRVLCDFCSIATSNVRPGDLVGRLGGEEFAVLLPDIAFFDAMQVAERIRARFAATVLDVKNGRHSPTVSIGVTMSTEWSHDLNGLMIAADEALYRAKAKGGDHIEATQMPRLPDHVWRFRNAHHRRF